LRAWLDRSLPVNCKTIASRDNPVFRELLALATDGRARRQAGRTLLDGPHLLEEALAAGLLPRRLVFAESAAVPFAGWRERLASVPALVMPDRLCAALSPVDHPVGLLAEIDVPLLSPASPDCMVLLENIQDPGNLGAILRVAAAAGVDAVRLSRGCAEAWSPKCLRGGQGAQFRLAIEEGVDLAACVAAASMPAYAARLDATRSLYQLDLRGPAMFLFGNEGSGLSAELCARAIPFIIPMPGRVESLNVATAAAVCLFERVRQRG